MEDTSPKPIRFDSIHAETARVLSETCQADVVITQSTLITHPERRNRLWRCTTNAPNPDVPASVMVKQVVAEVYDPDNIDNFDTQRFLGDWSGAAFLSTLTADPDLIGPRFYGGSRPHGFIVLEDLGEHRSLVEPLLEGDAPQATQALLSFAATLGKMHAAAYGKEAQFDALRQTLGPTRAKRTPATGQQETEHVIDRVNQQLSKLGTPVLQIEAAAREQAHTAFRAMHLPAQFRTFIHNDPCPDNMFYNANHRTLRLIDFEFARFGHALHDGLYGRIPFPTCWCCNRVVADVRTEMERVHRSAFGAACPAVLDDQIYSAEVVAVSGFWAVHGLESLEACLKKESQWGIAGIRPRILTRLSNFVDLANQVSGWTALQDLCRQIQSRLTQLWPDAELLPFYPALRGSTVA